MGDPRMTITHDVLDFTVKGSQALVPPEEQIWDPLPSPLHDSESSGYH